LFGEYKIVGVGFENVVFQVEQCVGNPPRHVFIGQVDQSTHHFQMLVVALLQQFNGKSTVPGQEGIQFLGVDEAAINIRDGRKCKVSEIVDNGTSASKNRIRFDDLKYDILSLGAF
jgi:hypothetical protein